MSKWKTCFITFAAMLGLAGSSALSAEAEKPTAGMMHNAHSEMMQEGAGGMMNMMQMMGQMNQMMENCNKMMQSMAASQDRKSKANSTPEKKN
jgi:periplasmic protein CpxP/Spy